MNISLIISLLLIYVYSMIAVVKAPRYAFQIVLALFLSLIVVAITAILIYLSWWLCAFILTGMLN